MGFSPDGQLVSATGSKSEEPRSGFSIWTVADGQEAGIWSDASHGEFSADSQTVALIGATNIRLWDRGTKSVRELLKSDDRPFEIRFAPRGALLAIAFGSGAVELWDTSTSERRWRRDKEKGSPKTLAFSPDGAALGAAAQSEALLLDAASGEIRSKLPVPFGKIVFTADSRTLITTGGEIQLWQASTGQHLVGLGTYDQFEIFTLLASPDNAYLAIGGGYRDENPGVWIWRGK